VNDVLAELDVARADGIDGITLLGGEPLAHAPAAAALAYAARQRGFSVMVFSGYTLDEARAMRNTDVDRLLELTDILVDGPYVRELPDTTRRWIGSTNQKIHFLTDRYRADDACWRERNTLEIRVRGDEISVNGFPARQAVGLWRKPKPVHVSE
jgi:anaerobic ribonucleoside-triphosphate reductase activating protein